MRPALQPFAIVVFAMSAFAGGAVPGIITALVWDRLDLGRVGVVAAGVLGVVSIAGDLAWSKGSRWARPLAVFRQVPRDFGHRFGPWKAAVRYGLRMGFGPATILVSWVWWAAFVIGVATGVGSIAAGSLAFAFARSASMYAATFGVRDGSQMARRNRRIEAAEPIAVRMFTIAVLLLCVLTVVTGGFR